jgi:hypothetical protein
MLVITLLWVSMWLGGPPDCSSSRRRLAIGQAMLVAGCSSADL